MFRSIFCVLLLALSACSMNPPPVMAAEAPVPGFVTDLPAFERYLATGPTPAQFASRYPDVLLVLPGQAATKELRLNRSRYFASLDSEGRITGGRFQ